MSTSRRALYGLLALGLMLSCLSAQAQSWPLSGPQNTTYKCRWSRLIGSTTTYGESRVTFTSLVGSNDSRSGLLRTEYKDGSVRDEAVTVNWIPYFGNNVFQLTVPSTGTTCMLHTYETRSDPNGGRALRFDGTYLHPNGLCSNGAFQLCARWSAMDE